jgi:preprotein translocase subunit SecY
MQIGEAKLSALVVSVLTGVGLTLMLGQAMRDYGFAFAIAAPVTLVMGAVLFLFASDNIKKGGEKPPEDS